MFFKRPFLFVSTLLATLQTSTFAQPGHRLRDGINERRFDHSCSFHTFLDSNLAMWKALTIFEVHMPQNTLIILISKAAQKWPYGQGGSNFRRCEKTRGFT